MVGEILEISGPAAFLFVSVFIGLVSFVYKVWNDVYQAKKEYKAKQPTSSKDYLKIDELDNRVTMLERQVKEIPKKIDEISEMLKGNDYRTNVRVDKQVDELKEMIKENKLAHASNYHKVEKKIDALAEKMYDLVKGMNIGHGGSGSDDR